MGMLSGVRELKEKIVVCIYSMCVCVCVCIYIYIYIYVCVCVCVFVTHDRGKKKKNRISDSFSGKPYLKFVMKLANISRLIPIVNLSCLFCLLLLFQIPVVVWWRL